MKSLIAPSVFFLLLLFAPPALSQTSASSPWQPWNDLPPECSHIVVIRGEQDRHLVTDMQFEDSVRLLHPSPNALAVTKEAILRMTPLLCQSIRRIVYGSLPNQYRTVLGAVNSFGSGDLLLINLGGKLDDGYQPFLEENLAESVGNRFMLQDTVIHEAAHAAETLLAVESKNGGERNLGKGGQLKGYGGSWGLPARTSARKTIAGLRLEKGMHTEWKRIHESFVRHGWAARYDNDTYERSFQILRDLLKRPARYKNATPAQIAVGGFMNGYGSKNWAEDMATFVSSVYLGPDRAAALRAADRSEDMRNDMACRELQGYPQENVPGKLAAVYAKLMFVLDLGLVTGEDVAKCTGVNVGFPRVSGPGFHFFEKNKLLRSFDTNVRARIGTLGALGKVFEMNAEGQATFAGKIYPANLRLRLAVGTALDSIDKVSWPRGFYKLGLVGPNNLVVRVDGARAGNFDAKDAFVLVGRSSSEYISGSVFLTQAWRPTAPIPVPQVFDPPLQIRFQMKK